MEGRDHAQSGDLHYVSMGWQRFHLAPQTSQDFSRLMLFATCEFPHIASELYVKNYTFITL